MIDVLCLEDVPANAVAALLRRAGLELRLVAAGAPIPNSYWGAPEAGIDGNRVWARADTPLHSVLHEACHLLLARRLRGGASSSDALSDDAEECAVCYLQVLLAGELPAPASAARALRDMDAWGYSFREGSAEKWFHGDGLDARAWLTRRDFLDADGRPLVGEVA